MKTRRSLFSGILLVVLAGCSGVPAISQSTTPPTIAMASTSQAVQPTAPLVTPSPASSPTVPPALLAKITAANCPVTIANGSTPPGERLSPNHHGNGALWTSLWPAGILRATPDYVQSDGSIDMKFWWWRGPDVHGQLSIAGHRLDGAAPPIQPYIPTGYGDTGFQASGITFPTEGCWEITGRAGGAELTFVTFVIKEQQQG